MTTLTSSETFLRGVDARPDRVPVILDERVSGGDSRLELRVGRKAPQTIATSRHSFGDVRVDHDDRGAPRRRVGRHHRHSGASRQLFVWSAAAGAPQQLTTGTQSTSLQSLDVAGDGGAVLTGWNRSGLVVARRAPGAGGFGPAATLATDVDLGSASAAGPGGRAVVAWTKQGQLQTAAADGAGSFGAAQSIAVPPTPSGATAFVDGVRLAATPTGRVVFAAQHAARPRTAGARAGRRVDSLRLDAGRAGARPGDHDLAGALLGRARPDRARGDRLRRVDRDDAPRPRARTRCASCASGPPARRRRRPTSTATTTSATWRASPCCRRCPAPRSASTTGPSRSARTYTITFDENGRAQGAALVAERTNADIAGALARNGSLLAWTRKLGATNTSYRVQTATP